MTPYLVDETEYLDLTVTEDQGRFISYAGKIAGARGGVGSGKSWVAGLWMLGRMTEFPRGAHYAVGADYPQLKRGFLKTFMHQLGLAGVKYTYKTTDGTVILDDYGAVLNCLSSELEDRIRSLEADTLLLEEPQTWKSGNGEDIYNVALGRLRGSPEGLASHPAMQPQMRMSFNPPAIGTWLHELVEKKWRVEGYPCWQFSVRNNYLMGRQRQREYIKLLEGMYDPSRWPVEIDGEWGTVGGNVYRQFNASVHGVVPDGMPPLALDPTRPLWWSHDFNVGLMCSVIAQTHSQQKYTQIVLDKYGRAQPEMRLVNPAWQEQIVYNLDEIALPDAGAEDVVAHFIGSQYAEVARRNGLMLSGDPSGGSRVQSMSATNAARTPWRIILSELKKAQIPVTWRVQNDHPPVIDRINMANAQFLSGEGFGCVVDMEQCKELVTDWLQVGFRSNTNDIEKKSSPPSAARRTHMSDADGYMKYVGRMLQRPGTKLDWQMMR